METNSVLVLLNYFLLNSVIQFELFLGLKLMN